MWWPRNSKLLLDEFDTVVAGHYGFTADELDFIPSTNSGQALNDDTFLHGTTSYRLRAGGFDGQVGGQVKYRLGRDAGENR
jgi:hypothetical protein